MKRESHYKGSRYSEFVRMQNYPKERKRIIKLQKDLKNWEIFQQGILKKLFFTQ